MSNTFNSVRYALLETASLLRDLTVLAVGVETSEKIAQAWLWAAGLVQLLFILLCTAIEEYAPVAGRYLGRLAGRVAAAGRKTRAFYDARLQEPLQVVLEASYELLKVAEYRVMQFVSRQLGDAYPEVRDFISPYQLRLS